MQISIMFHLLVMMMAIVGQSLIIDPTNTTCFVNAQYVEEDVDTLASTLNVITLSPFSQTFIEIDLRHMQEIPTLQDGSNIFNLYVYLYRDGKQNIQTITQITTSINIYSLYIKKSTRIAIYFSINDSYSAYKYLLLGSVSISVQLQNQRVPTEDESFLFIINNLDDINLPYNRPNLAAFQDYYLDQIPSHSQYYARLTTIQSSNDYWDTYSSFAVPYIPYLSNCHGQAQHIYLSQAMENSSDCNLVSIQNTVPIQEFKFGSIPTADTCTIQRNCVYDEVAGLTTQFPYWMTLPESTVLFYITKDKVSSSSYTLNQEFDSTELVKCRIITSQGTNSSQQYPLKVKLILEYYQMTNEKKRMINCSVQYSLYVESETNFQYQFEIQTKPLNHTYIMLNFGFEWYVYMIVFLLIGTVSNLQNFILWLFHSCVSRKQKKPFRIKIYLNIIGHIGQGTLIALVLFIILLFSVTMIMNGKIFQSTLYQANLDQSIPRVFWDSLTLSNIVDYESSAIVNKRAGRMGLSFLLIGAFIVFYTSKYFIGKQKTSQEYKEYEVMGRKFRPIDWNQGKFLFGTFFFIAIQFIFVFFAYSSLYSKNIWAFICLMKIIQIIMEEITKSVYEDLLPCLPLKVLTDIIAYMNTLSANNFYDFLFSFLIDVAMTMIEKAYISQLQNIVVEKLQEKTEEMQKFYANIINDAQDEKTEQKSQQGEEQEQENQNIFKEMRGQGEGEEVNFFEDEEEEEYKEDFEIQEEEEEENPYVQELQQNFKKKLKVYLKRQNKINEIGPKTGNIEENIREQNKQQNNEIGQRSSVFEMLLDNILLIFTFFLQPFVVLVFWVTYDQSLVLYNYGISSNTVILYLLSAVVIAIFTILNVVLIFHLLQSYLQIDFEEPITQLMERFQNRTIFWKANDQDINVKIGTTLRGADHYCLSFQFFFILTIYISSMVLIMLGISIMMNVGYNPFDDIATIPILIFWYIFLIFFIFLLKKFAFKINLWDCAEYQNNDNVNKIVVSLKEQMELSREKDSETKNFLNNYDSSSDSSLQIFQKTKKILIKQRKKSSQVSIFSKKTQGLGEYKVTDKSDSKYEDETNIIKLQTICQKLHSQFSDPKFIEQYFRKHKKYLKQNLIKILPEMKELPQIKQYKANLKNNIDEINNKQSKNLEPNVIDILMIWKNKVDQKAKQKNVVGLELQSSLKRCYYCYEQWGIYYYTKDQGMCLKCSQIIYRESKKSK